MIDLTNHPGPFTTRDGREVRIYARDGGGDWPIHGAIRRDDGVWSSEVWRRNGRWLGHLTEGVSDLIPAPTKHKGWVNVYRGYSRCDDRFAADVHLSEADARAAAAGPNYFTTIPIEWEE